MIHVSIPATVMLKEFDYNAEVELVNPVADTVATATFQGATVDWYIKAEEKPNQREQIKIQSEKLNKYFPSDFTEHQKVELIEKLVKDWHATQSLKKGSR